MTDNEYLSLDNSKPFSWNSTIQMSDSAETRRACGRQRGWDTEAGTDTEGVCSVEH